MLGACYVISIFHCAEIQQIRKKLAVSPSETVSRETGVNSSAWKFWDSDNFQNTPGKSK